MSSPGSGDNGGSFDDPEQIRNILKRALTRVCPAGLRGSIDDIVHDALIRTMELQGRSEKMAIRTASYLWQVAFTTMVDELRRRERRREVPLMNAGTDDLESLAGADPISLEASHETGAGIRDCLGRLAEPRRLVVTLYLNGFTAEESVRILGFDLRRVRNLTFRGLTDLRRCLGDKGIRP